MVTEVVLTIVLALMAVEGLAFALAPELVQRILGDASPSALRLAGLVELAIATVLAIVACGF